MSTLDVFQQVFQLSLVANAVRQCKGTQQTLQNAMQEYLSETITEIQGAWKVVWGPVVWKHDPEDTETGPDETWYIARNQAVNGQDTYVICVAGTATDYSMEQNNQVQRVVDFNDWVQNLPHQPIVTPPRQVNDTTNTYVAWGTARDTHRLLFYPAPEGAEGSGLTLRDFVENLHSSQCTFISTGLSRGGALSATLALTLFYLNAPPEKILAYPIAAPSPGNRNFAELFALKLPKLVEGEDYRVWNTLIFNELDIVSQAWCTDKTVSPNQNLDNIPGIYGLPALPLVVLAVAGMKVRANLSNSVYYPLQGTSFPGELPDQPPENLEDFKSIAADQHLNPYLKFFNVEVPVPFPCQDGTMTKKEVYLTEPVLSSIAMVTVGMPDDDTDIPRNGNKEEKKALELWRQLITRPSSD
ncbi:hypothetical protein GYMLUDRAFT_63947 [Collybiopsis luxurians FD-317 M1]|uniref:Fungal lipase-like domain-containing protein n=1 Tax=Collybiopsis luxurians FD-317 M1 TaxID=944289 RepID=A0A0D0CDD9_9AGAR|nr:hypothetical protein GYMLUDRAFT_63947 [Collybiopsis luxurians FD-317 M1]